MEHTRDTARDDASIASAARRGSSARFPATRTLVLSDVRLYREGLAFALSARGEAVEIAGTADSLRRAEDVLATGCDVVLLDVGMPDALDIARALSLHDPPPKVVAVAVSDEAADVVACAQAGVDGYVPRDGSVQDVAAAIDGVMRGELLCSPRMAATLFKRLATVGSAVADTASALTAREREVVALIDRGLSNKQIAHRLRIGTATVKNHVHNILEKLQVTRRAQAAAQVRAQTAAFAGSIRRRGAEETTLDPTA